MFDLACAITRKRYADSVAEIVKTGYFLFAPNEEGQAEIVNHPSFLYDSVEDAIDKIDIVLRQPRLQLDFRDHLDRQGAKFSTGTFMAGFRAAVEKFVSEKSSLRKRG